MAAPIRPTPVLEGSDAAEWRDRVEKEKHEKLGPVPTPNLARLRDSILADAKKRQK